MNNTRILIGGLVAGLVLFLGDGLMHSLLLQPYWLDIAATLHLPKSGDTGMGMFALYDLAQGLGLLLLYALIRPRLGPGPRTAAIAGLFVWALCIPIPLAGLIPIHFFGRKFALLWAIYALLPHVLAGVAGGALYRETAAD